MGDPFDVVVERGQALYERITRQWRSVVKFTRWFDSTFTPDAVTAA